MRLAWFVCFSGYSNLKDGVLSHWDAYLLLLDDNLFVPARVRIAEDDQHADREHKQAGVKAGKREVHLKAID